VEFREKALQLSVSDPAQLSPLRDWLRGLPGVRVSVDLGIATGFRVSVDLGIATPGDQGAVELGDQGAVEWLTIFASSSGLVAAIRTLPDFLRSRRPNVRIEATYQENPFVIDATNIDDMLPILERLINDPRASRQ
jgi:hypothetical protein